MTALKTSAEIEELKRKAMVLADLATHPGWKIISDKLNAEIANQLSLLQQQGLAHDITEGIRFRITAMRWLLRSTTLATDEQFAKWDRALAFQRQQEQNRQEIGLPANLKDLQP